MKEKPAIIHTVYFWLLPDIPPERIRLFEKGLETLGTCPQIMDYYWGPPAGTEKREVIDDTYSYAINVHFRTVEDQNSYQKDPIHLRFIKDHGDLWKKVLVYDNEVR